MKEQTVDLHPSIAELEEITKGSYQSIAQVCFPPWVARSGYLLCLILGGLILILTVVPWQQTSYSTGSVVPYHPNDRLQNIIAPTKGNIFKWHVVEGERVQRGEPIAELRDIDPQYFQRLQLQRDAVTAALAATEAAVETSKKNLDRQRRLASRGIKSQRDFELARLEFNKFLSQVASKRKELADVETKISRQSSQMIVAPRSGTIMREFFAQGAIVKGGDKIASLMPLARQRVVRLFVEGNDLPFIEIGSQVRLQFEGWPAVQVSGWPSTAIGTFLGVVKVIDPGESEKGQFRVLVFPDKETQEWPDDNYLRQGVRVKGWFLLGTVPLGYELWRQFNDFPPTLSSKSKKSEKTIGLQIGKSVGKLGK